MERPLFKFFFIFVSAQQIEWGFLLSIRLEDARILVLLQLISGSSHHQCDRERLAHKIVVNAINIISPLLNLFVLQAAVPRGYPPPSSAMMFDEDPGIMSEVETSSTGFRRGNKQRSSLPVVRTPSKTLERPLGRKSFPPNMISKFRNRPTFVARFVKRSCIFWKFKIELLLSLL